MSKETANTLLSMLEETVASGGGSNAYVTGYRVAGKTGTSQTPETDTTGRYVASFCGIAPADNPQIVILIVLDHPTVGVTSGGRQARLWHENLLRRYWSTWKLKEDTPSLTRIRCL